jgi:hypothetical protein
LIKININQTPLFFICGVVKCKIMYYRETIIDGVLYCKTTPNGSWREVSNKALTKRLVDLEHKLKELAYS